MESAALFCGGMKVVNCAPAMAGTPLSSPMSTSCLCVMCTSSVWTTGKSMYRPKACPPATAGRVSPPPESLPISRLCPRPCADNRRPEPPQRHLRLIIHHPSGVAVLLGKPARHHSRLQPEECAFGADRVGRTGLVCYRKPLDRTLHQFSVGIVREKCQHGRISRWIHRPSAREQLEQMHHLIRRAHPETVFHRAVHRHARASQIRLGVNLC